MSTKGLKQDFLTICNYSLDTSDYALVLSIDEYREHLAYLYTCLSVEEQARSKRYVVPDVADEFIIIRGFLRLVLSRFSTESPQDLVLSERQFGKLYCPDIPVFFNVSHSHGMGFIGLSKFQEVGVDLERIQSRMGLENLANRFFSTYERQYLDDLVYDEKLHAFYDIWTGKEAVSKAVGLGLQLPMGSYDVIPKERKCSVCVPENLCFNAPTLWHIEYADCYEGFSFCMARQHTSLPLKWDRV